MKKILIVENCVTYANLLCSSLSKNYQFFVEIAYSYDEAIKLLTTWNFDVAILDFRLDSRMVEFNTKTNNWLKIAEFIKSRNINIPVIMMTWFEIEISNWKERDQWLIAEYAIKPNNRERFYELEAKIFQVLRKCWHVIHHWFNININIGNVHYKHVNVDIKKNT